MTTSALKTAGARVEAMLGRPLTRQEQLIASLIFIYGCHEGKRELIEQRIAEARAKNAPYLATVTELRK